MVIPNECFNLILQLVAIRGQVSLFLMEPLVFFWFHFLVGVFMGASGLLCFICMSISSQDVFRGMYNPNRAANNLLEFVVRASIARFFLLGPEPFSSFSLLFFFISFMIALSILFFRPTKYNSVGHSALKTCNCTVFLLNK